MPRKQVPNVVSLVLLLIVLAACGEAAAPAATPVLPTATSAPAAATGPAGNAGIERARATIKDAVALYKAGQTDAAYEMAASAYLDNIEALEPDLLKADKDIVPSLEGDFKALRDGIKAGSAQADLDAIAARIDAGLTRAAGLLAK